MKKTEVKAKSPEQEQSEKDDIFKLTKVFYTFMLGLNDNNVRPLLEVNTNVPIRNYFSIGVMFTLGAVSGLCVVYSLYQLIVFISGAIRLWM